MKSYWVSIVLGAFMRWLNPTDASAWRRMVWWSGCLFSRRPTPQKKQAQMTHINQSSKTSNTIKYRLFTCLLVQSRLYHQHQITNTIQLYIIPNSGMGRTYRIIDDRTAKWMNYSLQAEIHSFASNHSDMTCPRAGYVRQVSLFCLDFFLVYWGLRRATVYNGKGLLQWCLITVICCIIVVKSSLSLPKRSGPGCISERSWLLWFCLYS